MNTLVALLTLVGLAACELQPAPPKKEPPPAPPPAAATTAPGEAPGGSAGSAGSAVVPAPAPPVAVVADAGVTDGGAPKVVVSADCLKVGAQVAQLMIDSAKDPAQHSIYEQERANTTRKTGEACTTQNWSEAARNCYLTAKRYPQDTHACEEKFPPPKQEPKQPKQPVAPVAPVPGVGPAGTDMKPEQPKPAKPAKH